MSDLADEGTDRSGPALADHVALLDKGKFVFVGTMDELYASTNPVVHEFVEEDRIRFEKEKEFV